MRMHKCEAPGNELPPSHNQILTQHVNYFYCDQEVLFYTHINL